MKDDNKAKEELKKVKDKAYNQEESKMPDGLSGDRYVLKEDDTAVLLSNACFVRNQLIQEILESYGIPIECENEDGTKSEVDELVDTNPEYSIQYDNEAYVQEEQAYAQNKLGTTLNLEQIDTNKSIGDLIVAKYKNGLYGTADSSYGEYGEIAGYFGEIPDKVGKWNLKKSIDALIANSKPNSQHACAKFVRMALEAGGISTAGRPSWAIQYKGYLPTIGFPMVRIIKYDKAYARYMASEVAPGDIAVMANPKGGPGHICMYTGSQWISDFRQRRAWVYRGESGLIYIFRYKGMTEEIKAEVGTELKGWGIMSVNGLSFMQACEGWSDATKRAFMGTVGTDATAGNQSGIDRGGVITVGPGLTNSVDKSIRQGVRFTAKQIIAIWSKTVVAFSKDALSICPALKTLPQPCKDMAVDCIWSGRGHFINAGWGRVKTAQDAAQACLRMVKTAKGKVVRGLADRRTAEAAICLGKTASGSAKRYTDAYYHPNPKIKALAGG